MLSAQRLVLILLLTSSTLSQDAPLKTDRSDFKRLLSKSCAKSYSPTCLKLDIASYLDSINTEEVYNIFPGVSIVREARSTIDELDPSPRSLSDPDYYLMKKINSYIASHSLRFNPESARGKKGGGGIHKIIALGAMMKGSLMAVALGALAALAGKALLTALISLVLSSIIGLKSLAHHETKQTYEVIAKPIYTHEEHMSHGGHHYGRSLDGVKAKS